MLLIFNNCYSLFLGFSERYCVTEFQWVFLCVTLYYWTLFNFIVFVSLHHVTITPNISVCLRLKTTAFLVVAMSVHVPTTVCTYLIDIFIILHPTKFRIRRWRGSLIFNISKEPPVLKMETTYFSETCNRLHGVTSQSLPKRRPTRRRVTSAFIWHRFVLRRLNVNRTFVLEVGVSTASAVCRSSCCRLHRSFCTLCRCDHAFSCLQLAALSKFIFNIPYYLDAQKQTFTLPDFASPRTGQNGYHVLTPEGRGEIV